jgi:hypothetical protein
MTSGEAVSRRPEERNEREVERSETSNRATGERSDP